MTGRKQHITVCVCTYQRPNLLKHLLEDLRDQETESLFTHSILVVDNDRRRSAESVIMEFVASPTIRVEYYVECAQSIALARNKAIEHASGDFIAFIDDDETPIKRWLVTLFEECSKHHVDGVLGSVRPRYAVTPPTWVVNGKFYDRPSYPTGSVIDWPKGRTGNVLLRKEVLSAVTPPFRPEFRTGEDQDFFRRVIEKGYVFIWCDEALAFEIVPPVRWNRTFLLRRALLRGYTSLGHPTFAVRDTMKSILAVPAYALALPFAFVLGQGTFMKILVRLFDHIGKVLGILGINPIKDAYVIT